MNIKANNITLVDIDELNPHPKNSNKHPDEQIDRLAKIIQYSGFRNPLIVSNQTGFIIAGHGRLQAAKKIGMKQVPVIYQDFESTDVEYQTLTADNAIALWADLDFPMINEDMTELGPDFDLDLLGIENFVLEPAEKKINFVIRCENETDRAILRKIFSCEHNTVNAEKAIETIRNGA